jgi:hypothetical protein
MAAPFLTSYRYLALDSGMQRSIMDGGKLPGKGDGGSTSSLHVQRLIGTVSGRPGARSSGACSDRRPAAGSTEGGV